MSNGHFDNWPSIADGGDYASATTGDFDTYMNDWDHTNPLTTGADRTTFIEQFARFATDYGYVRDRGTN